MLKGFLTVRPKIEHQIKQGLSKLSPCSLFSYTEREIMVFTIDIDGK